MSSKTKFLAAAAAALTMLGVAGAASADTIAASMNPPAADGTISGSYTRTVTQANLNFNDDVQFTLPTGIASVDISAILVADQDINFTSVLFNGTPLNFVVGGSGSNEFRSINNVGVTSGLQHINVIGTFNPGANGVGTATYTGNILFTPTAVPEPATWAMMILGMGMVGFGLRMRRRSASAVA